MTNSVTASAKQAEWVRETLARYEGPLLSYAQRLTGDLETARDVVQDTFLKLCQQTPGELDGHLSQWLYTVCRNRALDVYRKERRMSIATDLDQRPATDFDASQANVDARDAASKVLRMVDRLPINQQEVIRLKFQNELSYREISEVTGLTVTNVGFLLHVGIKRLRELLQTETALLECG